MFREMRNDGQKIILDASPRVILSVEPQHTYSRDLEERLNFQERDDQLVGTLYEFARNHEGADVRLLSHDTNPLYTAQGLDLSSDLIPENWLLQPESTEIEKKLSSLESEIARLKKTEPSFWIRCVDQSSTELECYCASFTWFEPLSDDQVDNLMQRLKGRFPLGSKFGSREPVERAAKRQTVLDNLFGNTKEVFVPATEEEIGKYREEAYPEWLDQCEQILRNHHRMLQHQAALLEFSFLAANVGTRPATDALVTIEAHGHFQIQPPSTDDEDDAQSGEDDELSDHKAEELPRPPVAPSGQWQRMIDGQPGDALRALDAFRRSLYQMSNMWHLPALRHDSLLRGLDVPPPSRDPNAFYYKPHRPSSPRSSFSLCCDQWRHDDGEEPFDGEIHLPVDQGKTEGALSFRIQASNLSKSASKVVPVRIKIAHVSAFESALAMVVNLLKRPIFRVELSSGDTRTSEKLPNERTPGHQMETERQYSRVDEPQAPIMTVTGDEFSAVDVEAPIRDSNNLDFWSLGDLYQTAVSEHEKSGSTTAARVFGLLSAIVQIHFKPEDRSEPCGPQFVMNGQRSMIPADLRANSPPSLPNSCSASRIPDSGRDWRISSGTMIESLRSSRVTRSMHIAKLCSLFLTVRENSSTRTGRRAAMTAAGCCAAHARLPTQRGGKIPKLRD